jgi:protein O-mannosyl-transferase
MRALNASKIVLPLAMLAVLAAYALLLWPALSGPFLFDDFPNLQNLKLIGTGSAEELGRYLAAYIGNPGRPIAALSFLINDNAWPSQPFSFKYTNLMIHLLNGVLLFGFLRQLAKASPSLPQSVFWPLLAMAAWLFHPLQISPQMLVVQRMTLLAATCSFAGLWAYVVLAQRAHSALFAFWAASALGVATITAFLCKESGALLPLFAWVLNATVLRTVLDEKPQAAARLLRWACIVPSLLLFAALLNILIAPGSFANREFNMIERMMTQMHVLADYLRQIFMPRLSGSGIYFDDYPVTRAWFQPFSTAVLAALYSSAVLIAILKRKQWPVFSLAVLWFFAGHLLESTFLNLELYFEHRNYLPLLGPVLALSCAAFQLGQKPVLGQALYSLWLVLLIAITSLQAPVWGRQELLTTLWAIERPNSLRATQELAKYRYDSGDRQGAVDAMMQSFYTNQQYADLPLNSLLAKCWDQNLNTEPNLRQRSVVALQTTPVFSYSVFTTLNLLRKAVAKNQCDATLTKAQWLELTDAVLANPKFKLVSEALIRRERAEFFIEARDLNRTMIELELAYAAAPSVELSQTAAGVLLSAGLMNEAVQWLENGLKVPQPLFDRLLYDQKKKSRQLLQMIHNAQLKKK